MYIIEQTNTYRIGLDTTSSLYWIIDFWISPLYTSSHQLPYLQQSIHDHLPELRSASCDNFKHLPFSEELKQTETAHLYEHIMLEYLCKERLALGFSYASYTGRTYWDTFQKRPERFTICIDKHKERRKHVIRAMQKSCLLLHKMIGIPARFEIQVERGWKPLSTEPALLPGNVR